jgi:cysteine desulfurase
VIYLDSASSEQLHPAALEALEATRSLTADVRRSHHAAKQARLVYDNARESVADTLAVRPDEIQFTSSGTQAVHRGVLGLHRAAATQAPIALSAVEHSSVRHAAAFSGAQCIELPPDHQGQVLPEAMPSLGDCALVAVQSANHEVGTVQPISELADAMPGVPFFVDACASMGRMPLPQGWSAAAGSAHKWGGPPGVGVLLVRKGVRWRNPFPGDDRAVFPEVGFENVSACFAAAAALRAVADEAAEVSARQFEITRFLRERLAAIADSAVVGHPTQRLSHLVTASFLYVDGETLVTELDRAGYAVASGSACAASTLEPSAVLAAMGALTHGNVRISLTRETTMEQAIGLAAVLDELVPALRARVGM